MFDCEFHVGKVIFWHCFSRGYESAFAKYGRDKIDSLGLPYDYGSIMHYPFNAFSKNGQPTLRALQPLNGRKPYKALSDLDAIQTNMMYGCRSTEEDPFRRKRRQIGNSLVSYYVTN